MFYQRRTVLYVDDTVEQRYAMRRVLENAGYTVIEAGTGEEALRQLRPDLAAIILDVKLPDMSGYEVCRAIKETRADLEVPILQVSASFADPILRAKALSGGADAYIAQPVHPPELINLLQSLILSYQSRRIVGFLAGVSYRISQSLNLAETFSAVAAAVAPKFCDHCYLLITEEMEGGEEFAPTDAPLRTLMAEVDSSGSTEVLQLHNPSRSVIATPLATGSKKFGSILFALAQTSRTYTQHDCSVAEDLAARIALAIQNAQLHTVQLAAQAALVQAEKIAAAGRMAAAIAHEINNPLEAVINLIYLVETSQEASDQIRKFAQDALSELSRLSHITRQTLGFYRELLSPQTFDVAESIDDILRLLHSRLATKRIEIDKKYEPSIALHGVKGEIRQVISNLILNAIDAMEEGGRLQIETQRLNDGEVLICIKDSGKGIPPQSLQRIFEPFFTTKNGTGTGLGLWVSGKIVHKHGGRIQVQSSTSGPERGTKMELVLSAKIP